MCINCSRLPEFMNVTFYHDDKLNRGGWFRGETLVKCTEAICFWFDSGRIRLFFISPPIICVVVIYILHQIHVGSWSDIIHHFCRLSHFYIMYAFENFPIDILIISWGCQTESLIALILQQLSNWRKIIAILMSTEFSSFIEPKQFQLLLLE